MRKIRIWCYFALTIGGVVIPLSCSKVCQTGYENPNCSIEIRAQYENLNYAVTESKNGDSAYTYSAAIISSPVSPFAVALTNVANGFFANNVKGVVSVTGDSLTIPYQNPDSNSNYIQGLGTFAVSTLTLTLYYTISYPDSVPVIHKQTDNYQSAWVQP